MDQLHYTRLVTLGRVKYPKITHTLTPLNWFGISFWVC